MTIAHKTGLIALALGLMAAALLLPPTAASANEDVVDEAVVAIVGTAHLSAGTLNEQDPDAPGCLGGVAVGLGTENDFIDETLAGDPDLIVAGTSVGAQFTYNNDLIAGDAVGQLWVDGLVEVPSLDLDPAEAKTGFVWNRVGFIAVVDLVGPNEWGVAVAALVPGNLDLFACTGEKKNKNQITHGNWGNEEHATVVGVGVISTLFG